MPQAPSTTSSLPPPSTTIFTQSAPLIQQVCTNIQSTDAFIRTVYSRQIYTACLESEPGDVVTRLLPLLTELVNDQVLQIRLSLVTQLYPLSLLFLTFPSLLLDLSPPKKKSLTPQETLFAATAEKLKETSEMLTRQHDDAILASQSFVSSDSISSQSVVSVGGGNSNREPVSAAKRALSLISSPISSRNQEYNNMSSSLSTRTRNVGGGSGSVVSSGASVTGSVMSYQSNMTHLYNTTSNFKSNKRRSLVSGMGLVLSIIVPILSSLLLDKSPVIRHETITAVVNICSILPDDYKGSITGMVLEIAHSELPSNRMTGLVCLGSLVPHLPSSLVSSVVASELNLFSDDSDANLREAAATQYPIISTYSGSNVAINRLVKFFLALLKDASWRVRRVTVQNTHGFIRNLDLMTVVSSILPIVSNAVSDESRLVRVDLLSRLPLLVGSIPVVSSGLIHTYIMACHEESELDVVLNLIAGISIVLASAINHPLVTYTKERSRIQRGGQHLVFSALNVYTLQHRIFQQINNNTTNALRVYGGYSSGDLSATGGLSLGHSGAGGKDGAVGTTSPEDPDYDYFRGDGDDHDNADDHYNTIDEHLGYLIDKNNEELELLSATKDYPFGFSALSNSGRWWRLLCYPGQPLTDITMNLNRSAYSIIPSSTTVSVIAKTLKKIYLQALWLPETVSYLLNYDKPLYPQQPQQQFMNGGHPNANPAANPSQRQQQSGQGQGSEASPLVEQQQNGLNLIYQTLTSSFPTLASILPSFLVQPLTSHLLSLLTSRSQTVSKLAPKYGFFFASCPVFFRPLLLAVGCFTSLYDAINPSLVYTGYRSSQCEAWVFDLKSSNRSITKQYANNHGYSDLAHLHHSNARHPSDRSAGAKGGYEHPLSPTHPNNNNSNQHRQMGLSDGGAAGHVPGMPKPMSGGGYEIYCESVDLFSFLEGAYYQVMAMYHNMPSQAPIPALLSRSSAASGRPGDVQVVDYRGVSAHQWDPERTFTYTETSRISQQPIDYFSPESAILYDPSTHRPTISAAPIAILKPIAPASTTSSAAGELPSQSSPQDPAVQQGGTKNTSNHPQQQKQAPPAVKPGTATISQLPIEINPNSRIFNYHFHEFMSLFAPTLPSPTNLIYFLCDELIPLFSLLGGWRSRLLLVKQIPLLLPASMSYDAYFTQREKDIREYYGLGKYYQHVQPSDEQVLQSAAKSAGNFTPGSANRANAKGVYYNDESKPGMYTFQAYDYLKYDSPLTCLSLLTMHIISNTSPQFPFALREQTFKLLPMIMAAAATQAKSKCTCPPPPSVVQSSQSQKGKRSRSGKSGANGAAATSSSPPSPREKQCAYAPFFPCKCLTHTYTTYIPTRRRNRGGRNRDNREGDRDGPTIVPGNVASDTSTPFPDNGNGNSHMGNATTNAFGGDPVSPLHGGAHNGTDADEDIFADVPSSTTSFPFFTRRFHATDRGTLNSHPEWYEPNTPTSGGPTHEGYTIDLRVIPTHQLAWVLCLAVLIPLLPAHFWHTHCLDTDLYLTPEEEEARQQHQLAANIAHDSPHLSTHYGGKQYANTASPHDLSCPVRHLSIIPLLQSSIVTRPTPQSRLLFLASATNSVCWLPPDIFSYVFCQPLSWLLRDNVPSIRVKAVQFLDAVLTHTDQNHEQCKNYHLASTASLPATAPAAAAAVPRQQQSSSTKDKPNGSANTQTASGKGGGATPLTKGKEKPAAGRTAGRTDARDHYDLSSTAQLSSPVPGGGAGTGSIIQSLSHSFLRRNAKVLSSSVANTNDEIFDEFDDDDDDDDEDDTDIGFSYDTGPYDTGRHQQQNMSLSMSTTSSPLTSQHLGDGVGVLGLDEYRLPSTSGAGVGLYSTSSSSNEQDSNAAISLGHAPSAASSGLDSESERSSTSSVASNAGDDVAMDGLTAEDRRRRRQQQRLHRRLVKQQVEMFTHNYRNCRCLLCLRNPFLENALLSIDATTTSPLSLNQATASMVHTLKCRCVHGVFIDAAFTQTMPVTGNSAHTHSTNAAQQEPETMVISPSGTVTMGGSDEQQHALPIHGAFFLKTSIIPDAKPAGSPATGPSSPLVSGHTLADGLQPSASVLEDLVSTNATMGLAAATSPTLHGLDAAGAAGSPFNTAAGGGQDLMGSYITSYSIQKQTVYDSLCAFLFEREHDLDAEVRALAKTAISNLYARQYSRIQEDMRVVSDYFTPDNNNHQHQQETTSPSTAAHGSAAGRQTQQQPAHGGATHTNGESSGSDNGCTLAELFSTKSILNCPLPNPHSVMACSLGDFTLSHAEYIQNIASFLTPTRQYNHMGPFGMDNSSIPGSTRVQEKSQAHCEYHADARTNIYGLPSLSLYPLSPSMDTGSKPYARCTNPSPACCQGGRPDAAPTTPGGASGAGHTRNQPLTSSLLTDQYNNQLCTCQQATDCEPLSAYILSDTVHDGCCWNQHIKAHIQSIYNGDRVQIAHWPLMMILSHVHIFKLQQQELFSEHLDSIAGINPTAAAGGAGGVIPGHQQTTPHRDGTTNDDSQDSSYATYPRATSPLGVPFTTVIPADTNNPTFSPKFSHLEALYHQYAAHYQYHGQNPRQLRPPLPPSLYDVYRLCQVVIDARINHGKPFWNIHDRWWRCVVDGGQQKKDDFTPHRTFTNNHRTRGTTVFGSKYNPNQSTGSNTSGYASNTMVVSSAPPPLPHIQLQRPADHPSRVLGIFASKSWSRLNHYHTPQQFVPPHVDHSEKTYDDHNTATAAAAQQQQQTGPGTVVAVAPSPTLTLPRNADEYEFMNQSITEHVLEQYVTEDTCQSWVNLVDKRMKIPHKSSVIQAYESRLDINDDLFFYSDFEDRDDDFDQNELQSLGMKPPPTRQQQASPLDMAMASTVTTTATAWGKRHHSPLTSPSPQQQRGLPHTSSTATTASDVLEADGNPQDQCSVTMRRIRRIKRHHMIHCLRKKFLENIDEPYDGDGDGVDPEVAAILGETDITHDSSLSVAGGNCGTSRASITGLSSQNSTPMLGGSRLGRRYRRGSADNGDGEEASGDTASTLELSTVVLSDLDNLDNISDISSVDSHGEEIGVTTPDFALRRRASSAVQQMIFEAQQQQQQQQRASLPQSNISSSSSLNGIGGAKDASTRPIASTTTGITHHLGDDIDGSNEDGRDDDDDDNDSQQVRVTSLGNIPYSYSSHSGVSGSKPHASTTTPTLHSVNPPRLGRGRQNSQTSAMDATSSAARKLSASPQVGSHNPHHNSPLVRGIAPLQYESGYPSGPGHRPHSTSLGTGTDRADMMMEPLELSPSSVSTSSSPVFSADLGDLHPSSLEEVITPGLTGDEADFHNHTDDADGIVLDYTEPPLFDPVTRYPHSPEIMNRRGSFGSSPTLAASASASGMNSLLSSPHSHSRDTDSFLLGDHDLLDIGSEETLGFLLTAQHGGPTTAAISIVPSQRSRGRSIEQDDPYIHEDTPRVDFDFATLSMDGDVDGNNDGMMEDSHDGDHNSNSN